MSSNIFPQGSWVRLDTPTDVFLRAVHFTDSLTGWAVGDLGTIIHTTDGGEEWSFQESNMDHPIADVFFLDAQRGWAAAQNYTDPPYGTLLLTTENSGLQWDVVPYPEENIFINCILFLDSLNGWMGGSPHAIVRTTDGGETWEQAAVDTSTLAFFPVLSINFWDDQFGYASGGVFDIAGVTWRTSDGGETWQAIDVSDAPADEVHELHLLDSVNVIGIGGDPDFAFGAAVIRTADGGENWEYEEIGIQGNGFDIDFRNDLEVWAPMGPQQTLIYSLDAGQTWTPVGAPENTEIYEITFPDHLHGYAVGREGAFLEYIPPTGVSVPEIQPDEPAFELLQNYPNPFSELSVISYELSVAGEVLLVVFDSFGREVEVLVKETQGAGEYEVIVDGTGLVEGFYFYQLTIINPGQEAVFSETKKMILTK